MLKIRDLGLNTLPEAYDTAAKKGDKKGGKKCSPRSHCEVSGKGGIKKNAISRDEIQQLQHQLLQKMADEITH